MNELLYRNNPGQSNATWRWSTTQTADTSGNGNTGTLVGGAQFPAERFTLPDPFQENPWPPIADYAEDSTDAELSAG